MKKYLRAIFFMLCLFTLTACGGENNVFGSQESQSEFYDIQAEEEEVFDTKPTGTCFGLQFYGEETVQIWRGVGGVWLLKAGGGFEQLLPEYGYFTGNWFLTSQGQSVLLYDEFSGGGVRVLNREGEKLFSVDDVSGLCICETEEGKIYLLAEEDDSVYLARLDIENGLLIKLEGLSLSQKSQSLSIKPYYCLGLGPEGLMLLDSEGVWKIEEEGNKAARSMVMSFDGTSYMDMISDPGSNPNYYLRDVSGFRVREDGSAEILWRYEDSGKGLLQTLRLEKVEKKVLRLRCVQTSVWLTQCIKEFNQTNENYRVVLDQFAADLSDSGALADFTQRTDMEIGAGKGADLISGQASYNFSALLEKGRRPFTGCLRSCLLWDYGLTVRFLRNPWNGT